MEKILIVDDEEMNRRMLGRIFERSGYSVERADSGASAMQLIEKEPPDIIILDIVMPEQDGFEVCRKIKAIEKFKMIPIIFISALFDEEDKAKGFEAGASDYITKPIRRVEILDKVKVCLKKEK